MNVTSEIAALVASQSQSSTRSGLPPPSAKIRPFRFQIPVRNPSASSSTSTSNGGPQPSGDHYARGLPSIALAPPPDRFPTRRDLFPERKPFVPVTPKSILKKRISSNFDDSFLLSKAAASSPSSQESHLDLSQYISDRIEDELEQRNDEELIEESDPPDLDPPPSTQCTAAPLTLPVSTPGGSASGSLHLRSVNEIVPRFRSVFRSFPYFNVVQSQVFDDALHSDRSLVVSAPTGSGKTVVFELAILWLLDQGCQQTGDKEESSGKMIYMSPMKSLCGEKFRDWNTKFGPLGVKCLELTGSLLLRYI